MVEPAKSVLSIVQANVAPFPALRAAFDTLYGAIAKRQDVAFLLSGSLAGDTVSDLSDLDIEVVAQPGTDVKELAQWLKDLVWSLGKVIAQFPASHLGLPDLHINFIERDGTIVKVDVWAMGLEGLPFVADATVLHDPGGFVAAARAKLPSGGGPTPDYSDLHQKFVGWMWFTFSKIRRDQLFEAVESLDVMRSFVILPFLHLLAQNPPHGYRYLEKRLPAEHHAPFLTTFPSSHDRPEVARAFWAMVDLFRVAQTKVGERLGGKLQGANLERMVSLIRDYDESHGR
jgi:hypothetical protein